MHPELKEMLVSNGILLVLVIVVCVVAIAVFDPQPAEVVAGMILRGIAGGLIGALLVGALMGLIRGD
jgi:predicted lipid-binding transport protein (Tim44 family)